MQLEQQETFEIKSPQLEVFGQVESKLPAPAKKRPFAAGFLAVMVLVSVFGIGGVQLKSRYRNVAEIYTSEVDKHGNSIQGDFTTLTDTAANLMRACQKVLGEADSNCTTVADLLAQWQDTAIAPAAQYAVIHQLDNAVDAMYTAAKAKATDDALDQINSLDASYVSTQSILQREIAQNYTTAAQSYNTIASAVLAAVTAAAVWAVPAAAAASVQGISSTSCIADNANILSRDTETYITNISVALQENCSGAQIGVYTTDYVGNNTMEGYAYEVFQAWGLGSADQDNGMVLLMATGDDNYWATPGEGLETAFSGNVLSDLLYDNLEASWAKQDYDTGARKTVLAMAERICDVYGVSLDMDAIGSGLADSSGRIVENTQSRSNGGAVLTLILLTIIIAVIVIAILKTPRGPRGPQGPTYTGGRGPNVFFFGGPVYRPRRPRRPPPPPPPGGGFGNPGPRPGGGFGGPGPGARPGSFGPRPGGGFGGMSGGFRSGGGSTRGGGAGRR